MRQVLKEAKDYLRKFQSSLGPKPECDLIGTLIDQFGWMGSGVRPLDLGKIIGLGLLMLGAWLVVRPS
ncbi:DMT family transporter [Thermus scotoductus]|uniref:DMT family transporter n=1 Tax=Thermus scotoductus TaxID=37636 RepID=UPI003F514619